jgi:hypothetical protein
MVGDLLDFLAADVSTGSILLYLETIPASRKFMSAARSAARAKPVIAIKSGRTSESAKAAATHTGALAGSDEAVSAAFRRARLVRVDELEELFTAAETLTCLTPVPGNELLIVTNGGGAGVLAVDDLMRSGGGLARLRDGLAHRRAIDHELRQPHQNVGDGGKVSGRLVAGRARSPDGDRRQGRAFSLRHPDRAHADRVFAARGRGACGTASAGHAASVTAVTARLVPAIHDFSPRRIQ